MNFNLIKGLFKKGLLLAILSLSGFSVAQAKTNLQNSIYFEQMGLLYKDGNPICIGFLLGQNRWRFAAHCIADRSDMRGYQLVLDDGTMLRFEREVQPNPFSDLVVIETAQSIDSTSTSTSTMGILNGGLEDRSQSTFSNDFSFTQDDSGGRTVACAALGGTAIYLAPQCVVSISVAVGACAGPQAIFGCAPAVFGASAICGLGVGDIFALLKCL